MIHGVTRESGRGIPKCVYQQKQKRKKDIDAARGTFKAAVLQNDEHCGGKMVAVSFYDSKPVYFLSHACKVIKWIKKVRDVYSHVLKKMVKMGFLRPNIVDEYNNGMNHVDLSDQLRLIYRFDRWMRKQKWWWSMFF